MTEWNSLRNYPEGIYLEMLTRNSPWHVMYLNNGFVSFRSHSNLGELILYYSVKLKNWDYIRSDEIEL